uniref:Reverse transcriptase zinc-binding domain-containing protein n=1 Tax=Chenopodium quinoa TaxID=63459 RepID=A0A803LM40_CHEQI
MWCFSGKQKMVYSIRSRYWLTKGGEGSELAGIPDDEVWRVVWNTHGPPKLQHFLWSEMKGNLAIKNRLIQCHISNDASCQICGQHDETIWYSLIECVVTVAIWGCSDFKSNLVDALTHSFADYGHGCTESVMKGNSCHGGYRCYPQLHFRKGGKKTWVEAPTRRRQYESGEFSCQTDPRRCQESNNEAGRLEQIGGLYRCADRRLQLDARHGLLTL